MVLRVEPFFSVKTFYETDLETTHMLNNQEGHPDLCEEFGRFYEKQSQFSPLSKCIRFKFSQLLYCHGELDNYQNYTK